MSAKDKIKSYEIKYVNKIMDNVHGLIGLTKVEDEIERLPIFKRLHYISQLGLVQRVFPGALHTRYIHSLGVMHVSDMMAISLGLDPDERQILRLAALLHDIGHYPFSHDVELVYMKYSKMSSIVNNIPAPKCYDEILKLKEEKPINLSLCGSTNKSHHEQIGKQIITHNSEIRNVVLENYVKQSQFMVGLTGGDCDKATNLLLEDIGNIVIGNASYKSLILKDRFTLLVQLLHSEMDADNIDYLLRDATFSGTSYGAVDVGLLISNLKCKQISIKNVNGNSENHYIVGVSHKGIVCVEQFLFNRYFAYNQVVHHKYAAVLGAMLRNVVEWMMNDSNSGFEYVDILKVVQNGGDEKFIKFTDNYLYEFINRTSIDKCNCPGLTFKIIGYLKGLRVPHIQFPTNKYDVSMVSQNDKKALSDIKKTDVFKELKKISLRIDKFNSSDHNNCAAIEEDLIREAFQYDVESKNLTSQIPSEKYIQLVNDSNKNNLDKYKLDRLLNGIALIDNSENFPELLVDCKVSLLHDLHKLKYIKIRKYEKL